MPHKDRSLPSMGYLVTRYPAISHTFILREIQQLRRLGWHIDSASVNRPDRALLQMDEIEKKEAEATYVIKADGLPGAWRAAWWCISRYGLSTFRVLASAWSLGGTLRPWKGLAYAVEAMMVARWMQRKGLRHLHVHFGNSGATVGVLTKRLNHCHLSFTIHGPDEFDDVPGQHLVMKMQEADAVVCISQFARSQLMRLTGSDQWQKMQVCHLGVEAAQFPFRMRMSCGVLELLCVGRLTPAKCQLLLVQACARLRDAGLSFHLKMVGDGPDRMLIEKEMVMLNLQDRITMTGALNQQEVREALQQADVFVLPSLAEGIPVVLMEAMCCGVPCVTTRINGIPELIEDGFTGLLATPGDLDSLTSQLHRMMSSAQLRRNIAEAAHEKVRMDFDLVKNVQRLNHIFQQFPAGT